MRSEMVLKLNDLFIEKGWTNNKDLLTRFTTALSKLEDQQQELIINLTKQYTYIPSDKYEDYLIQILDKASSKDLLRNKIYVIPLLKFTGKFEKEMKQVKSSNYIAYLFKSTILKSRPWIKGKNIKVYNFLLEDDIKDINVKGNLVIFIDDYIGSGRTAKECIDNYITQGLDKKNILVVSLYIEESSKSKLEGNEINYITSEFPMNNINDLIDEEQKEELKKISKRLGSNDEPFGYANTGGLVSMIRTPNNTLPFYWVDKKGRIAPFPR